MIILSPRPRPTCATEGCTNPVRTSGKKSKLGFPFYKRYCSRHSKALHIPKYHYRRHKKDKCARCGFVALHHTQLDVDHIDGDHRNNDPANLQTLCKNCHVLKTYAPELIDRPPV